MILEQICFLLRQIAKSGASIPASHPLSSSSSPHGIMNWGQLHNMRQSFLAILFACLVAGTATSQQPAPIPPNASAPAKSAANVTETAKSPDYAQESFVIEQMHSRYRFEADGTGRKETIARIRIQSEAG